MGTADLPPQIGAHCQPAPVEEVVQELRRRLSLRELQRQAVLRAMEQAHGSKLQAAKILGMGKTTLYRKLKEIRGNP